MKLFLIPFHEVCNAAVGEIHKKKEREKFLYRYVNPMVKLREWMENKRNKELHPCQIAAKPKV